MLVIVELPGVQAKEAKILRDVKADAGLIVGEATSARVLKQVVEVAGDIPVGVSVKGADERQIEEFAEAGCDFLVFDMGMRAGALRKKEDMGKFLTVEHSLDQGLVRAINSLEVDGVLIMGREGDSFLPVERLLVCRRFVELLEKSIIVTLPSEVTKADLTGLWEVGVDGVVAPSGYSAEALIELREMVSDLPKRSRGRRPRGGAMLPRLSANISEDEEGDEEEEDV
jgi:hypothetical protein